MVLGRRGLSAILLAVAGLVFYVVFLAVLTTESSAQTDGDDTDGEVSANQDQNDQGDEGCPNPESVDTFTGTESQSTPSFNITGSAFRLRYETEATNPDAIDENLAIRVLEENGDFVDSVLVLEPQSGSTNILAGPGTFRLQIDAGEEVEYTVTVEDCVGTSQNNGNQNGQNRSTAERTTPSNVMRNTIPKKRLPPTGGLPVGVAVTGSVLAGAGLLGLGFVIRRGSRG